MKCLPVTEISLQCHTLKKGNQNLACMQNDASHAVAAAPHRLQVLCKKPVCSLLTDKHGTHASVLTPHCEDERDTLPTHASVLPPHYHKDERDTLLAIRPGGSVSVRRIGHRHVAV
jgi:hypothetical protein